jgi:hypothetical protein
MGMPRAHAIEVQMSTPADRRSDRGWTGAMTGTAAPSGASAAPSLTEALADRLAAGVDAHARRAAAARVLDWAGCAVGALAEPLAAPLDRAVGTLAAPGAVPAIRPPRWPGTARSATRSRWTTSTACRSCTRGRS